MKKATFTPKAKKATLFVGVCLICGGVLTAVLANGTNANVEASGTSSQASSEADVSVAPILKVDTSSGTGSAFVPSSGAVTSASLTTVSKPTSAPPKPTPPASSALTDKSKKPSYSSKPTVSKSSTSKVTSAPKGKSYMPGFGYVDGTGGGQGTTVGEPGDQLTGNKVGTM